MGRIATLPEKLVPAPAALAEFSNLLYSLSDAVVRYELLLAGAPLVSVETKAGKAALSDMATAWRKADEFAEALEASQSTWEKAWNHYGDYELIDDCLPSACGICREFPSYLGGVFPPYPGMSRAPMIGWYDARGKRLSLWLAPNCDSELSEAALPKVYIRRRRWPRLRHDELSVLDEAELVSNLRHLARCLDDSIDRLSCRGVRDGGGSRRLRIERLPYDEWGRLTCARDLEPFDRALQIEQNTGVRLPDGGDPVWLISEFEQFQREQQLYGTARPVVFTFVDYLQMRDREQRIFPSADGRRDELRRGAAAVLIPLIRTMRDYEEVRRTCGPLPVESLLRAWSGTAQWVNSYRSALLRIGEASTVANLDDTLRDCSNSVFVIKAVSSESSSQFRWPTLASLIERLQDQVIEILDAALTQSRPAADSEERGQEANTRVEARYAQRRQSLERAKRAEFAYTLSMDGSGATWPRIAATARAAFPGLGEWTGGAAKKAVEAFARDNKLPFPPPRKVGRPPGS